MTETQTGRSRHRRARLAPRERARDGACPPPLWPPPNGGYPEWRRAGRYFRPPARSPLAIPDGELWPGRDRGAARQARQRGGQDNRVEEFGAARLPAANQACRFADCRRLSVSRRYLYVASSSSAPGYGTAGTEHHVTAFRIDPESGALSPHGTLLHGSVGL